MQKFIDAARANVDRHIGDICTEDNDTADIQETVMTLAFDGAVDAGCNMVDAAFVASHVVEKFAAGVF